MTKNWRPRCAGECLRYVGLFLAFLIALGWFVFLAGVAFGQEDLADPERQPPALLEAPIDWRCAPLAGRDDKAYLPCGRLTERGEDSADERALQQTRTIPFTHQQPSR